jgi:hypothetical protein
LQLARLSQHAANSFPGPVLHATDCFLGENQHAVQSIPKEISTRQIPFQKKLARGKFRSRRNREIVTPQFRSRWKTRTRQIPFRDKPQVTLHLLATFLIEKEYFYFKTLKMIGSHCSKAKIIKILEMLPAWDPVKI